MSPKRGQGGELVPVVDRAEITRLGQGVDRARTLAPEAVERTLDCLARYAAEISHRAASTRVDVVGTSAMRDAGGEGERNDFIERASADPRRRSARRLGRRRSVARVRRSGSRVSRLEGDVTAFDVGGGSTEIIGGGRGQAARDVRARMSIDVGSVRLFERHVRSDPPSVEEMAVVRAFVADQLPRHRAAVRWQPARRHRRHRHHARRRRPGHRPLRPAKVHGMRLGADELGERRRRRLSELPLGRAKSVTGLEPKRADVIPVRGGDCRGRSLGWARADGVHRFRPRVFVGVSRSSSPASPEA